MAQGLRLVAMMKAYDDLDEFMGLWRTGTGAQFSWTGTGSKSEQFKIEDKKHFDEGLRLVAFSPYGLNAVWRPGSGAQRVKSGMSLEKFKEADSDFFNQGLRLVDFYVASWF